MKLPINKKTQQGFTLVELLVVIGILTILLAIVLIAINPARQFSQANNTQRRSDVLALLNAIDEYMADNNGQLPRDNTNDIDIGATALEIGNVGVGGLGPSEIDLCSALVPVYIAEMPVDPVTGTGSSGTDCSGAHSTGYTVLTSGSSGRVTVAAPDAELSETISVTR
jgi:prepilin-type N-terminal cleavage/methylation domain-containing protein